MAIIENKYRIGVKYVNQNRLLTLRGIILLLEDLACRHSDMVGFGINDTLKTNLSWVLLNWKIKILKEANYGSTVTVKSMVKRILINYIHIGILKYMMKIII